MAKISVKAGATSVTVNVFIQDSSSTTGAGLTGLAYNTASLTAYYALPQAAAAAITLATLAAVTSSYSSGGFKEIDATNMPGWYRFDIPNAALASGRFSSIHLKGATNMAPLALEIELTAVDNQSATAFITGVNSLAPPTNWNLHSIDSNGRVDVIKVAGTTQTAGDIISDTNDIQTRLPAALVSGRMDASVGAMAANVMTAAAAAADLTTELQTGLATAAALSTVNSATVAIQAKTDNLPSDPADQSLIIAATNAIAGLIGTPAGVSLSADVAAVKSETASILTDTAEIEAIKAVTDKLDTALELDVAVYRFTTNALEQAPSGGGGGGGLDAAGVRAAIGLASANLDTQLADLPTNSELSTALALSDDAVLAILGTPVVSVSGDIASLQSDTNDIQVRLPATLVGGRIDANMGAISSSATAADNLEQGALGLVSSTCAVGSTTTSILTNLTEATDDHYNGRVITFTSGALSGQTTSISDYNGTTKTLTVVAITEAPASTDTFVIS